MADHSLVVDDDHDKFNEIQNDYSSCDDYGPIYSTIVKNMEDRILSEKMIELTTKITPIRIETIMNDVKIKNSSMSIDKTIQDRLELIPIYLTKENKAFQSIIDQALRLVNISIPNENMHDYLQHICILIYKMHILTMYHSLWTTYWKSGFGQLIKRTPEQHYVVYPINISIWPKEIKRIIQSIDERNTDISTNAMNLVSHHRQELERQLRHTQMEWNEKVYDFTGYNLKVEQLLQDYINENLYEFEKEIEHKITLVTYDYHIEAIKQEFNRQNPTEYQKKLMKKLCLKKDEKQTTEQELKFQEERIHHFNASNQSSEYSAIIQSVMIDPIENIEIRQQLQQQCRNIIEQAKTDFCMLSLQTAEDQRTRAQLNHDNQQNKLYDIHHNTLDDIILPSKMIDLITERCRMIGERIQSVYKYKIECFRLKLEKQHVY